MSEVSEVSKDLRGPVAQRQPGQKLPMMEGVAPGYPQTGGACGPVQLSSLPYEALLQLDDIQGNVLGGFNKDYQTLIYVKLGDVASFRSWLKAEVGNIATAREVVVFNRLFKAVRQRRRDKTSVQTVQSTAVSCRQHGGR